MVVIPAGSFTMGSPETEEGRFNDEEPQRQVTLARAFAMGRYTVTRGQFAQLRGGHETRHVWRAPSPGQAGNGS